MSEVNVKVLGTLVSCIGLLFMAGKKSSPRSQYFTEISSDLNKAENLYKKEANPDEIIAQFAITQDKVHSSKFESMSPEEQSDLAGRFTNLGNTMMQG